MSAATVTLSARAAKRLSQILEKQPGKAALRVSVVGGGCSGFSYTYDLVGEKTDDDTVVARDGVEVLIDSVSLPFLEGSEIDFVDDLIGQSFQINNPNAVAACGCGVSFTV